jgi:hypothetical protein
MDPAATTNARQMLLPEREARTLLLVRAVEETDGEGILLSPHVREAATRRVFDDAAITPDEGARLRARAALLGDALRRDAPWLAALLDPPRSRGVVIGTLLVAAALGAASNLLGPHRHVSVLAFPLAGILGWNLAVYAALLAQSAARLVARARARRPRLRWVAGCLESIRVSEMARRLRGGAPSLAVVDAVARFHRLWLAAAAPLATARVRAALHLAAAAMAAGATGGMYASGIAFEYRATWESTWLDASSVRQYLGTVLGPASRLLGLPIPDVAPLRGPAGDGPAAPWIHLWAATLGLFVVAPRAALALVAAIAAARLARRLPVEIDAAYARRALHAGRGAASVVEIVYYGGVPDVRLRERLHATLQEEAGARAVIRDGPRLAYGDGPEAVELGGVPVGGQVAVVFAVAQTPEVEVHGEFLRELRERVDRAGSVLTVVLETATYAERVGSAARVRERRAAWERLLRDLDVTPMELMSPAD